LNALVGEAVAATDAGECTRVVTWYRDGPSPKIMMHPVGGGPQPLAVVRRDGALHIDLGGTPAEQLDRLVVDWPAQSLRIMTLIDTPGIASLSAENARRTVRFLEPDDDTPTEADAVIYLMRHLHVADAEVLESFRARGVATATGGNTVAGLSRADAGGAGRLDGVGGRRAVPGRGGGARTVPERRRGGRPARPPRAHPAAVGVRGAHPARRRAARRPGEGAAVRRPVPARRVRAAGGVPPGPP